MFFMWEKQKTWCNKLQNQKPQEKKMYFVSIQLAQILICIWIKLKFNNNNNYN